MDVSKQLMKYQEGLIACAVSDAFPSRKNEVYWNDTSSNKYVDPDITFGGGDNSPEMVICVAHCDSVKESNRKFWRNAGELALCKTRLESHPLVLNIIFEPFYKPEIISMMYKMFDGQLSLLDDIDARNLVGIGPELVKGALKNIKDKEQVKDYLYCHIVRDDLYKKEFNKIVSWIKKSFSQRKTKNTKYWDDLSNYTSLYSVDSEIDFVPSGALRRGISKLLCFSEPEREAVLSNARKGNVGKVEEFAFGLGWVQPTLRKNNGRLIDQDIIILSNSFDNNTITSVIEKIPEKVMEGISRVGITPCRNIGTESKSIENYFVGHSSSFTSPKKLEKLIIKCFNDPSIGGHVNTDRRWIIDFGLAAGKATLGRPQGYGLSQMAREMNIDDPDSLRFWVPEYNSGKKLPENYIIEELAIVLSKKFKEVIKKKNDLTFTASEIIYWLNYTLVQIKLCTYPLFKPAEILFQQAAISSGYKSKAFSLYVSSLFTDNNSAGETRGLMITKKNSSYFIKVQSGSKNTRDKAKELGGRISCSLQKINGDYQHSFTGTILVLDGPFKEKEAAMCKMSGWDYVIPIDQLGTSFFKNLK